MRSRLEGCWKPGSWRRTGLQIWCRLCSGIYGAKGGKVPALLAQMLPYSYHRELKSDVLDLLIALSISMLCFTGQLTTSCIGDNGSRHAPGFGVVVHSLHARLASGPTAIWQAKYSSRSTALFQKFRPHRFLHLLLLLQTTVSSTSATTEVLLHADGEYQWNIDHQVQAYQDRSANSSTRLTPVSHKQARLAQTPMHTHALLEASVYPGLLANAFR